MRRNYLFMEYSKALLLSKKIDSQSYEKISAQVYAKFCYSKIADLKFHYKIVLSSQNLAQIYSEFFNSLPRSFKYFVPSLTDQVPFIWTGGRKCNFEGCDRSDLQPGEHPLEGFRLPVSQLRWHGSNLSQIVTLPDYYPEFGAPVPKLIPVTQPWNSPKEHCKDPRSYNSKNYILN